MHRSIPAEHAQHDLDLIAGHAAGDLTDTDRSRADALLNSCPSCADLRRDLIAIAAATHTLPAPATAPRDFRLTPAQAASLRRGRWIETLLRPFAAPRSTVRPLAMAFTSLGIAGLLVANILPAMLMGSAASAPEAVGGPAGATAAPAPAATEAQVPFPVAGGPQATRASNDTDFGSLNYPSFVADGGAAGGSKAGEATTPPQLAGGEGHGSATAAPSTDQLGTERDRFVDRGNPIVTGSLILLAIGLALFGLRFVARRVR